MKPFSTGLIGAVWVSLFAVDNAAFAQASADRPNIIVFYTDDHGHADLSCQGVFDDVKTPNVDGGKWRACGKWLQHSAAVCAVPGWLDSGEVSGAIRPRQQRFIA